MCFCLLTLLHLKVVLSRGWDDCSACIKLLFFQGKLLYAFTYFNTCHPHATHQFLNSLEEGQFTIKEN
jgi:hypothetical protein